MTHASLSSASTHARLAFWRLAAALAGQAARNPEAVARVIDAAPFVLFGALALSLGRIVGHLILWLWT